MHSIECIFVIGLLFVGMHVCTFQPGHFTGWGSEGVKSSFSEWPPGKDQLHNLYHIHMLYKLVSFFPEWPPGKDQLHNLYHIHMLYKLVSLFPEWPPGNDALQRERRSGEAAWSVRWCWWTWTVSMCKSSRGWTLHSRESPALWCSTKPSEGAGRCLLVTWSLLLQVWLTPMHCIYLCVYYLLIKYWLITMLEKIYSGGE